MGDFVKGPLPDHYPEKIRQGLHLHRRIDTLSHSNQHTRNSRQRLNPKFGHGRGIIVDIFYDHFLATDWSDFSDTPLEEYATTTYQLLEQNHHLLPPDLQQIAPLMSKHNWLVAYRRQEVVARALQRISERLSKPLPLAEGLTDMLKHENALREDFRGFMADAERFVQREMEKVETLDR